MPIGDADVVERVPEHRFREAPPATLYMPPDMTSMVVPASRCVARSPSRCLPWYPIVQTRASILPSIAAPLPSSPSPPGNSRTCSGQSHLRRIPAEDAAGATIITVERRNERDRPRPNPDTHQPMTDLTITPTPAARAPRRAMPRGSTRTGRLRCSSRPSTSGPA